MNEKQDWSVLIDAYNVSGLTQKEFCLRQDVNLEQFKWRLRLSRRKVEPVGNFVRLAVVAHVQCPSVVELHLPNGFFVRLAGDVGTGYLRELIAGLGS